MTQILLEYRVHWQAKLGKSMLLPHKKKMIDEETSFFFLICCLWSCQKEKIILNGLSVRLHNWWVYFFLPKSVSWVLIDYYPTLSFVYFTYLIYIRVNL